MTKKTYTIHALLIAAMILSSGTVLWASSLGKALPEGRGCSYSWVPDGTHSSYNLDGSMNIELPEGYFALPFDGVIRTDEVFRTKAIAGGITCTCDEGSGDCSPIHTGGEAYCAIGSNCTTCTREDTMLIVSRANQGVVFADNFALRNLPFGSVSDLLRVRVIREEMESFMEILHGGNVPDGFEKGNSSFAPAGYKFTPVNVYGYVVYALVSEEVVDEFHLTAAPAFSCECLSGSSGCEKDSGMGWRSCVAGDCQSCHAEFLTFAPSVLEH